MGNKSTKSAKSTFDDAATAAATTTASAAIAANSASQRANEKLTKLRKNPRMSLSRPAFFSPQPPTKSTQWRYRFAHFCPATCCLTPDDELAGLGAFAQLPNELLVSMLLSLSPFQVRALSCLSRAFYLLCSDDYLWHRFYVWYSPVIRRYRHKLAQCAQNDDWFSSSSSSSSPPPLTDGLSTLLSFTALPPLLLLSQPDLNDTDDAFWLDTDETRADKENGASASLLATSATAAAAAAAATMTTTTTTSASPAPSPPLPPLIRPARPRLSGNDCCWKQKYRNDSFSFDWREALRAEDDERSKQAHRVLKRVQSEHKRRIAAHRADLQAEENASKARKARVKTRTSLVCMFIATYVLFKGFMALSWSQLLIAVGVGTLVSLASSVLSVAAFSSREFPSARKQRRTAFLFLALACWPVTLFALSAQAMTDSYIAVESTVCAHVFPEFPTMRAVEKIHTDTLAAIAARHAPLTDAAQKALDEAEELLDRVSSLRPRVKASGKASPCVLV